MYKAQVNGGEPKDIVLGDGIVVDNKPLDWDISELRDGYFHIVLNDKSYTAELVRLDADEKLFIFTINGHQVEVSLQDRFDLLLDKLGMADLGAAAAADLKAPMPGLILDLMVADGQEVAKGEPILILEAMKMENILKAPGDGVVKSVKVGKGDSVEKNQVLVQF